MSKQRRAPAVIALGLVACLAVACGADGDSASPTTSQDAPTDSGGAGREHGAHVETDATSPVDGSQGCSDRHRVIPVNGDLAEIVWALGCGDQVVATDISATYPPEADETPKIGYQRALVAEEILTYEPTLILADDLAGPPEVLDQLAGAGVELVDVPRDHTLDEPAAKIRVVADALGVDDGRLADDVQAEIDEAVAAAPDDGWRVMALYLRGDAVQLVFGRGSGVDAVIAGAGGVDVGTELGIDDNEPLSAEAIVDAAPDVVLVSQSGLESVGGMDGLMALDGLNRTPAADNGHVYAFEDQRLFGLGPRTGGLLTELVDIFETVEPAR